ncbi:MAG: hypothetical protein P8R54_19940, partial [Myxococcota bacterium]|nr:hypothetical protein [Myxococcota bacterium]
NGWRYWYFAWEFPNTYYAKLGAGKTFRPFGWTIKGWKYINNYLLTHGIAYVLPLLFFALGGLKNSRRRRLSVVLIALLAFMVFYDGKFIGQPEWLPEAINWPNKPSWWRSLSSNWVTARVWTILGMASLMGLITLSRSGWRTRGMLWAYCASGVFFALYAGGDWMDEWRWFNIISVSLFPLLAVGLGELLDFMIPADIKRRLIPAPLSRWGQEVSLRVIVIAAVMIPFAINEINRATRFSVNPETSVRDIHRRVRYMTWVQNRLDVDDIVLLDVDMGAHMYYSGWDIVDIAGLVDVSMARHSDFNKKFIGEYLFEERLPDFAHVHAGWARSSKIPRQKSWKKDYIEIPGYPIGGRKLHVGNHIRKDLFIERHTGEEPAHRFEGGIELLSYRLPSPEVAPGGQVHLRTWWRTVSREEGFRTLVWLDDGEGNRSVTALEPGYGWYAPEEWSSREKVAGRFWIQVPGTLPPGTYQVGIVLLDDTTGEVLPLVTAGSDEPVFLAGEVILAQTVQVVPQESARQHAEEDRAAAGALAVGGDCEAVWPKWKDATRHLSRNTTWRARHEDTIRTTLAGCWLARAEASEDRAERIAHLKEVRRWDHHLDGLSDLTEPLSAALDTEGDALFAQEDWEESYRAWSDALALNPSLSWTRRKAEEARDKRLVISRPGELLPAEGAEFTPQPPGEAGKRELRPGASREPRPMEAPSDEAAPADEAVPDKNDAMPELPMPQPKPLPGNDAI